MAQPVTRIQPTKLPTLPASTTPEQRYWLSFKSPLIIHEYGSVSDIHFSPLVPHDFAITTSTLIKVFSSKTRTVSKTISRFKDIAYSGHIRSDGKIIVAGDATGLIQVFNLASRAILKTWDEHKQPVQVTKFSPSSLTTLLSASDDTTVRLWDLPSGKSTNTFLGHGDYVRNAAFLPSSATSLVVSGSYDGTVRLWDPRTPHATGSVMTLSHPSAVDALLPMPGATTILVGSGPIVQVWDIVAAKPLTVLQNHQKTVTSIAVSASSAGRRVLTAGLDGHVKIYDPTSWKVVHGVKYPSPVLSVGVSPDEKHLAVGMVGGLLSIRTRSSGKDKIKQKETDKIFDMIAAGIDPITGAGGKGKKEKSSSMKRKLKGLDYKGEGADILIDHEVRVKKERAWEKELRKGRYADALDGGLKRVCSTLCFRHLQPQRRSNFLLGYSTTNYIHPLQRTSLP